MQPSPPIEGPQRLLKCPACTSPHVTSLVDYNGQPQDGEAVTHFTCQACDHAWETKGGRMTPANSDETFKCLNDLELYGFAIVDGKGIRIHPSMAIFDDDGLHDSNGRPLYKPTPVVFP